MTSPFAIDLDAVRGLASTTGRAAADLAGRSAAVPVTHPLAPIPQLGEFVAALHSARQAHGDALGGCASFLEDAASALQELRERVEQQEAAASNATARIL